MLLLEFQQWRARTRSHTRTHRNRLSHIRRVACREKTMEKRSKERWWKIYLQADRLSPQKRQLLPQNSPSTPGQPASTAFSWPYLCRCHQHMFAFCPKWKKKNQESGLHIELRHVVLVDIIRSLAVQPPHCGFWCRSFAFSLRFA